MVNPTHLVAAPNVKQGNGTEESVSEQSQISRLFSSGVAYFGLSRRGAEREKPHLCLPFFFTDPPFDPFQYNISLLSNPLSSNIVDVFTAHVLGFPT